MKNKLFFSILTVSVIVAVGSGSALGWMYAKVRAYEREHNVSIVSSAALSSSVNASPTNAASANASTANVVSTEGAAKAVPQETKELRVTDVSYYRDEQLKCHFSETPDMEAIRNYIEVSPMNEGNAGISVGKGWCYCDKVRSSGNVYGHEAVVITGDYAYRTNVTVRIRKGLPAQTRGVVSKQGIEPLKEDFTCTFVRDDMKPEITIPVKGRYLPPLGRRRLAVEATNVDEISIELRRVEPRNIVQMLARDEDIYQCYYGNWRQDGNVTELSGEPEVFTNKCEGAPNEVCKISVPVVMNDGGSSNGIFWVGLNGTIRKDCKGRTEVGNACRVVCVSDFGISVRSFADGVGVWVTSLSSGRPVAGAKVEVYSAANILVAKGIADAHGWCVPERVANGVPFAVVASSPDGSDMSFVALRDSMKVDETYADGEREEYLKKGECDAFLWTDRGIYRHGEKIFLHGIIRNGSMKAPKPFPVEVELLNPNESSYSRCTVMSDANGAISHSGFSVPSEQPSGVWTLLAKLPGKNGNAIGRRTIKIEEFAPPQIRVDVSVAENQKPEEFMFDVSAEHLFGGPARFLKCGGAIMFEDAEFAPAEWKGFSFGNEALGLSPNFRELAKQSLDADGKGRLRAPLWESAGLPKAAVRAIAQGIVFEDGGRPATARKNAVCHYYPYYIGTTLTGWIKRPDNGKVVVPVACVAPDGRRLAEPKKLSVKVERIDSVFAYREDENGFGRWDSERVRETIYEGSLDTFADKDAMLLLSLPDCGDYALTLSDPDTNVTYGRTFYASSWGDNVVRTSLGDSTKVSVQADKAHYRVGDVPRLIVKSPFTGAALMSVLRDGMVYSEVLELTNATSVVELRPVDRSWAPNVDVTFSVVQSVMENAHHLAVRAHGQTTLSVRPVENEIPVKVEAKVSVGDSSGSVVAVDVDARWNAATGAVAVVTVVDEAINIISGEPTPDPVGYLSYRRTAEHPLYDIYSRVLPVFGDDVMKSGVKTGGGFGAEMFGRVSPVPTRRFKPLSIWRDAIPLTNGCGHLEVRLPEFVGEVRVTAVAYSDCAVGAASVQRKVTPKLVMQPDAPRFVAPGDTFELTLPLFNRSGADGDVHWQIEPDGTEAAFQLIDSSKGTVNIADGGRALIFVKAKAGERPGQCRVRFSVQGYGERHSSTMEIPVRPAVAWRERAGTVRLEPGEIKTFAADGEFARQAISVSGSRIGELSAALEWLADYPHGCLEQTASRIFPLITAGGILNSVGSKVAKNRSDYVAAGVRRIESMVRQNDFVIWPDCDYAPWDKEVSLYAAHFLMEAERAGIELGKSAKAQVAGFLEKWAVSADTNVSAYACHTLALCGKPNRDRMLRLFDSRDSLSLISRARLARAFAATHDAVRAEALLANVSSPESVKEAAFATLALLEVKPDDGRIAALVEYLIAKRDPARFSWGTTESNAHALLALGEYCRRNPVKTGKVAVSVKPLGGTGKALGDRGFETFTNRSVTVENCGDATAFVSWRTFDLPPVERVKDESNGIFASRRFLDASGDPMSLDDVKCGDLLQIEISITSAVTRVVSDLVVEDLFPGAFEPVHSEFKSWYGCSRGASMCMAADGGLTQPMHRAVQWMMRNDARDDRMLVFGRQFTIEKDHEAVFRYPVRAVSAGDFVLPGTSVEGMYHPALRSRRAAGRIVVRH